MPQVAVALLKVGFFVFEAFAGAAAAATLGAGAAVAIGAAVVVGGTLVAKRMMSLFEVEIPTVDSDASRQRTVRSTIEPQKIIYGEALVSGPISFIGLSGTDNSDLYQTIVLAGHELNDITDIHMDDVVITDSQINGGSDAGGNVTAGTFGPKNSNTICVINKHLGEASQTADVLLTGPFANYTSAHRGDGIAYLAMKWVLNEDSAETWEKFAPSNVKALVQGKSIYDPRLEFAAVATRGQDTTNASYITYSTNPALCVVDYLTDTYLGMGIAVSKIDWDSVTTAADGCDVSVSVPGGTESRFTCNGVVFATDSHQKNINKILSSMNGNLVYSNGKYIVHAGIYEAPTETLNEDDLIGAISIKTSLERSDRFNTIKGLFIDPSQNHKSSEFPKVQLADAVTRDNNEILEKEVQYPMTNSSYMAQRLSFKLIKLSDQQKIISFPANLSALRITAGDRVKVSIEELSWSDKIFQCVGWNFSEEGGVNLTLREDSESAYDDPVPNANPALSEYSTITATGDITDAFRGVPSPSGLTVTPGLKSNELNWVNPGKTNDFGTIYVYASRNANFSSAIKIGETDGTQFIHDGSNKSLIFFPSVVNVGDTYTIRTLGNTNFVAMGAASNTVGVVFTATATGSGTGNLWETLSPGNLRYYWVRAVKNVGTDDASRSGLEPPNDPNTTVFATVGAVEVDWDNVADPTIGIDINNDTISINTGVANTTTGQAVAQSGISEDVTITQGGIRMNQGGSIRGGQTSYNSGEGFFLGYDSSKYKLSIRNSTSEALTFDGDDLSVTGTVNASAGVFTGDVSTDAKFIAGSNSSTVTLDGTTGANYSIFAGADNGLDASFKVASDGVVEATRFIIRDDANGQVLIDTSNTANPFSGVVYTSISQGSGAGVDTVAGTLADNAGEITITTTQAETFLITAKVAIDDNDGSTNNISGASTTSTTDAENQLKGADLKIEYYLKEGAGAYALEDTEIVTFTEGTPSSSQIKVFGVDRGAGYSGSLTRYFAVIQGGGAAEFVTYFSTSSNANRARTYAVTTASISISGAGTHKIKILARLVDAGTNTTLTNSTTPALVNNNATGTYGGSGIVLDAAQSPPNQSSLDNFKRIYEATSANGFVASAANTFAIGEGTTILTSGGTISGDLVITGDLTVQGTTTTINVADLTVADKDITLNYSTGDSSSTANNAGIIIQDAVNSTTDASILWKTTTDSFEFSHPVNPLTVNSSLNLRSAGGEVGIYLQDSSASNATAFKIYADVTLATSTLYIDYDPSVAGNNWAFVNNGNFLASGTIFADGAASNSLQWEAGYDYSQVGHLPLAGGTLTGDLNIVKSTDALISLKSTLNANDPVLRLEDGSGIATAGFEIWYDNSGGDTHFNSTYDNAAGAIRFHTRTGAAKSSSNERFTITADGAFDFHDGLLGDVQVSTLRTANGIIDSSLDNTVQINSDDHSALLLRTASHANVFSVMPWSSGNIYLTAGGHYDGTSGWKVTSNASTPYLSLFNMSGSGASFYFSTDVVNGYVGAWNIASNRTLWNEYGRWDGDIDTSFGITLNGDIDTTAFDLDSAQGQLNIGKAGDRFTLLEDEDTGYTNTSIGGLGFLSRNAYDSYITSNAYYYRTGGGSSWRSKYSNRHVGILELSDGRLIWSTSNSAATAANQSASLSTRFQIDSDGGGLFNSSTAINGNGTYVGNAGYHTLTLQDTDGYAGISFKDGNKNWLLRKNGDNDDFEFSYSGNASAQGVGTFASVLTLRDTGNIIVHTGNVEIQEAVLSHNTSNAWRGLSVTNTGDANECTVDGFSSDGTQQFIVYGGSQSQGFLNPTNYNWRFKVPLSGNLQRDGSHDLFDAGNYASSVTLTGDTTGSIPLSTNTGALSVATSTTKLSFSGQYVWDASDEPNETSGTTGQVWHRGITTAFVQSSDGYPSFGSVVRIKTYPNDGAAGELYFPYSASYGGNHIKFRLGLYNNAGRTAYRDIVDTSTHHQSKDGGFSADVFSYQGDTQYYLDLDPAASNHLRIADATFDLRGTANSTTNNGKIYLGIYNGPANNTGTTEGPAIIWKPNYSGYTKESVKIAYIAENNYFDGGLSFQTNGGQAEASGIVERFRIRNDNISYFTTSLGIKKTNPNNSAWGTLTNVASIFVSGTNYGILNLEGSSNTHYTMGVGGGRFYMAYEQGVNHMITVRSGSVGVGSGNTSPNAAYSLDVDGDVLVDGDLVLTSSDTSFNGITIGSSAQTIYSNQIWYSNAGNFQIWKSGTLDSGWGGASNTQIYSSVGSIHFHPAATANQFVIQSDYVRTNRGLKADSSVGGSYGPMFSANSKVAQASVGHTSSGSGEGIFFHTSGSYSIADRNINGSGSTWSSNTYRQLTLDWPTGVRIQTSNEGTYAYSYLDVNAAIYADEGIHAPIYYDQSGTSYYLDLASTGDSLRVAGNIVAYYSDERLKDIEKPIPDALEKVKSLTGFYYRPNEKAQSFGYKDKREVGVSAQAVERILPEVVTDAAIDPEYKTVDYARLVPLLIEAIKDLSEELQTLKKDIKENK